MIFILQVQEAALLAIGQLAVGKPSLSQKVFEFFYSITSMTSKNVEFSFTIGEALCSIAFGFEAKNMDDYLDLTDTPRPSAHNAQAETAKAVIDKVLGMANPQQSATNRKNAAIWLLCLVKYCGENSIIQVFVI